MWGGRLLAKRPRRGRVVVQGMDLEGIWRGLLTSFHLKGWVARLHERIGVWPEAELERGKWLRTSFVHFFQVIHFSHV
jgi:hypothetical protein